MDPLRFAIAFTPLSAYLLLIGAVNLRGRPLVTSGGRDLAALGLSVSGLMAVGPMELFLPAGAAMQLGGRELVWCLMLALYLLSLVLCVLSMRPRLIIYNITSEKLHNVLLSVVEQLDGQARWAGDSLMLPRLGVQLYVEPPSPLHNAQLVSSGPRQSHEGWRLLESMLSQELKQVSALPNVGGVVMIIFAIFLTVAAGLALITDPQQAAQVWVDMMSP